MIERWLNEHGMPTLGRLEGGARAEGGDTFWLDERTLCVGRTLRTNRAGVEQLRPSFNLKLRLRYSMCPTGKGAASWCT